MNPTRFAAAAALTFALGGPALAEGGSEAYPAAAAQSVPMVAGAGIVLPGNGSEAAVQTAASLPRGFSEGTAAYTQAQSVARYFAAREERNRLASQGLRGLPRG